MRAVVLTHDERAGRLVLRTAGMRDRLRARWNPGELDRSLAQGVSPEASAALGLRARVLSTLRTRRTLGRSLERLRQPRTGLFGPRVAPDAAALEHADPELRILTARLLSHDPVDVSGVAQVQLLLSDGTGPLYWPASSRDLAVSARNAAEALDDHG